MRGSRLLLPVVLSALGLTACGGARNAITIQLDPRHASGLGGVVRLAPAADGTRLRIRLDGATAPTGVTAAVYRGPCLQLPERPLSDRVPVEGGAATLHVDAPPQALRDRAVALKRNGTVLACADVPAGAPPRQAPE